MATIAPHEPTTIEDVLKAATDLAPRLADRAEEIEEARRVPPDLLDDLVASGCFRALLPASHGGFGADLPTLVRLGETLALGDASVAWTVMIGNGTWLDLVGLPRATFDGLYADGPDVKIAGVFGPGGVAVPVDEGYRVSGRWGFASGIPHADWVYGNCVEETDGEPRLRIALFAPDDVTVEDTWHVLGLRGTASHHFRVDNLVVPAAHTWAIMEGEPSIDEPAVRIPPPALFASAIATVALGTARGALEAVTTGATTRVPLLAGSPQADSPTFQHSLAIADTDLRAARALLYEVAEEAWATAAAGADFTLEQRARLRAAAAGAVERAATVVTAAYRAGGGSAVYTQSPLQRRLRDVHTVTQHFLVRPDTLTTAGRVLSGHDIDVPVF